MEDLWPDFDGMAQGNNSIEILRAQAKALSKKTNGKVKATFSKVDYNYGLYSGAYEVLNGLASAMSVYSQKELLEEELANKTDVNTLLSQSEYKFEIYNDKFRFRVFKVIYSKLYPIDLIIDKGIATELSFEPTISIGDDSQLKKLLEKIFFSRKIVSIVNSLMIKEEK